MVIDMLGLTSLDTRPQAYANPLTTAQEAMFRSSGITCLHNSMGFEGPKAREEVLSYFAAWAGFAGRHTDLFLLVGTIADLDCAKAQGEIAMIMGVQNADHFHTVDDVKAFHQLGQRCSQLTYSTRTCWVPAALTASMAASATTGRRLSRPWARSVC